MPEAFKSPGASLPEEKRAKAPSNSVFADKGKYSNNVLDQVRMTAMSYQDYYARCHNAMENAGMSEDEKTKFMLLATHEMLLGMHKGGSRVLKALEADGASWKDSKHLRKSDREYLEYAEKNLEKLKGMGISLEAPEAEVLSRISGTFGVAGQEAVRNARLMPIYGEVITDREHLRKGDRVLAKDYGDGKVLGLRGGNVAATAILYMTTFMTCQGVSVKGGPSAESFVKTTAEKGNEAYAGSSDDKALKRIGYTNDRVEKLKKQGMFAIGLAMFTKGRFDDLSAYYVMEDQLQCGVSLLANPGAFVEGQAPVELLVGGALSITKEESTIDRGGNKPMKVEISRKGMETPSGEEVYKKVYETTPITAANGGFIVKIPKAELDANFKAGDYIVTATYAGDVLGEHVECGSEVSLNVEKAVEEEIPEKKKRQPLKVSLTIYGPKVREENYEKTKTETTWTYTPGEYHEGEEGSEHEGGKGHAYGHHPERNGPGESGKGHGYGHHPERGGPGNSGRGHGYGHMGEEGQEGEEGSEGYYEPGTWDSHTSTSTETGWRKLKTQAYKLRVGPIMDKGLSVSGIFNYTEEWFSKRTGGGKRLAGHETKPTYGGQVNYETQLSLGANQKVQLEARLGAMFRENFPLLAGMGARYGDPRGLGQFGLTLGTDVGKALREIVLKPGQVSAGMTYSKDIKDFSLGFEVSDLARNRPNLAFTIGYRFR